MAYRTIEITWLPRSKPQWDTFTAARKETARLWSWLVERHADARQRFIKWPTKAEIQKEVKQTYFNLNAQSVQQTVGEFFEAIASAESLRKNGRQYHYPYKKTLFRQVTFTNQCAKMIGRKLRLPCGQAGALFVDIPASISIPGRMIEVRLNYGSIVIVCKIEDQPKCETRTIGVDLGVNTVLAATDGEKAVMVSGREIKATVQYRNKQLAGIFSSLSSKSKGSRRHKKLQKRKYKILKKTKNKIRDLCHKSTRKVADAFPGAKAYVGKPFNDACQKMGRQQAQMVGQSCNRKLINLLNYKLSSCIEVNEAYSSQTCPSCGTRSKHRRVFRCQCGFTAPRDIVGCLNIRAIGIDGEMRRETKNPVVNWVHPCKYPGVNRVVPSDTGQVDREKSRESDGL